MSDITAEQYEAATGYDDPAMRFAVSLLPTSWCFIDNGDGTLSPRKLDAAIDALGELRPGYTPDTLYDEELKARLRNVDHETICANNALLQHLKARNANG